ncbi:hypothetical protein CK203_029985 [Vitis vinifera]|uniref:J domain-containing protein n=1 Tax=Vitis vinifera TaxID=29760 RepID=A0A438IK42_VITVI|nr:hypothetical protein CK203_029985 [Vitis vinifera]
MSKRMLVILTKLVNIAFLELHPDEDQVISYYFRKVYVSLGVKEKSTVESRRRNYNNASLRVGHGNPLSEPHYRGDGLMLFNCNGLIPMTYSFNSRWLRHLAKKFHADLVGREYRKVIDGENVIITNLEAKFVPKAEIVHFGFVIYGCYLDVLLDILDVLLGC